MDACGVVEWLGHCEHGARRCSDDGTRAAKQNEPLAWLNKRGKLVGVEEVTMAELLA